MTREEAIKFYADEIMLLELAPTINGDNGSSMKEEWKRQADIHRLAISALREQEDLHARLNENIGAARMWCRRYHELLNHSESNTNQRVSNTANALGGWISVEERLPTPFVSVLVYMPGESPLPTVHEGFLAREGVWYANHFDREPMEITHWMPLPEPPKEEV